MTFRDFPDSVEAWLAPDRFELPFDRVELLSDDSARLSRTRNGLILPDTIVRARRRDNLRTTDFFLYFRTDTGQDSLWLEINPFSGQLKIDLTTYIYQYSYRPFAPPFKFVHSPVGKFYMERFRSTPWSYLSFYHEFNAATDTAGVKRVDIRYW